MTAMLDAEDQEPEVGQRVDDAEDDGEDDEQQPDRRHERPQRRAGQVHVLAACVPPAAAAGPGAGWRPRCAASTRPARRR